ncbi:MAG: nSTAND1 domain-containing NTPase [Gammaproteobacteria bacterium]
MSCKERQSSLNPDNPFPGLSYYEEKDHGFFFGRESEKDELFRRVKRDPLTVLFGQSGLGKTSLIQAGLFPLLREEQCLPIPIRIDYDPSAPDFEQQIAAALKNALAQTKAEGEEFQPGITLWEFFHRVHFWSSRNRLLVPVLVFDQFEEVFTLGQHNPRTQRWLQSLADLIENRIPLSLQQQIENEGEAPDYAYENLEIRVVLALREDFLPDLEDLKSMIPSLSINRMRLTPLNGKGALEAIRGPAPQLINAEVAEEIVRFVAGTEINDIHEQALEHIQVEPALLNLVCQQLNQNRLAKGLSHITSALLRGSKRRLLPDFYVQCLQDLPESLSVFIEENLITPTGFRRAETLDNALAFPGVDQSSLMKLVDRRLLRREERFGIPHLELIHDVLTKPIKESRDRRRIDAERAAVREREKELIKKLRRTRLRAIAWFSMLFILLVSIVYYNYCYVWPYTYYARSFTKQWGVAYPVGLLPYEAVSHRSSTFRFTRKGRLGQVLKMEVIDANHKPIDELGSTYHFTEFNTVPAQREKVSSHEYVYDNEGKVVSEIASNRFEQMIWGFVYPPLDEKQTGSPIGEDKNLSSKLKRMLCELANAPLGNCSGRKDRIVKAMFLGSDGYPKPPRNSRAESLVIGYNDLGFETMLRYTDWEGNPAPGPNNAFGMAMDYDEQGRMIQKVSLDQQKQPMIDETGKAGVGFKYDNQGNRIEVAFFDATGKPTLVNAGFNKVEIKYDQWGRETEKMYFGLNYEPVIDSRITGAHLIKSIYDDSGNMTSMKLFGKGSDSDPVSAGFGLYDFIAHEQRTSFDKRNRPVRIAYYDADSKPKTGPDGWHSYEIEYDERGFVKANSYFADEKNTAVIFKSLGAHRWEAVNDEFGLPREERFFDTKIKPVVILNHGYHLRKNTYDEDGNLIEQTYLGVDEKQQVADKIDGAHKYVKRFDRFRNPVLTEYYDENGQPVNNIQGFHRIESTYDAYGSVLNQRWYDKNKLACNGPEGGHYKQYTYDSLGLLTRIAFYDVKDHPTINKQGIHEEIYEYNGKRLKTSYRVFGLDKKPVINLEGYSDVRNVWDEDGNLIKERYYGANGAPVIGPKGFYRMDSTLGEIHYYDTQDHKIVLGPATAVPIIYVENVLHSDLAAAQAGLQSGDILWRYGNWYYSDLLENELLNETTYNKYSIKKIGDSIYLKFITERDRFSNQSVSMTVIRDNKFFNTTMPPLHNRLMGVGLNYRMVPRKVFTQWEKAEIQSSSE